MSDITFFGETTFRNARRRFGIKRDDRRRHLYTIGKTGMGKTVLLKNMAIQDIQSGEGMGFIDPHGEASEELLSFVPQDRIKDVVYINPADMEYPIAFNVMEDVDVEHRHLVASGLMSVFKKIWPDVWSARMEYILNNTILALLEYPGSTLLGVNRMLSDPAYREEVVSKVQDPVVKAFWTQEFARYTQRFEVEATAAIQNKVGQFISNPLIRNIVGQSESSIDMRDIMDGQKILIANISKGRVGEDNSRLLGALITTKLQLAAMSRVDVPESERKDFFLYIDEFQNFATESFINILSEARKYRLALTLSHQYVEQLEDGVKEAVFGNVGTIVSFRVGAEDAEFLEKEFSPEFLAQDFVNLGKYNIYAKLMIDGLAGRPFSAEGLAPFPEEAQSNRDAIIAYSRQRYGTPLAEVEEKIATWSEAMDTRSAAASAVVSSNPSSQQQQLYDARCATCGKDTKVVFEPDGKRPIYCKSCRKKQQSAKEQNNKSKEKESKAPESISLSKAVEGKPTFFHPNSKKSQERQKPQRKEVNKSELREALRESLQSREEPVEDKDVQQRGSLGPGETAYL